MRVKYLAQEHNAVPRPGFEPGPLDPKDRKRKSKELVVRFSRAKADQKTALSYVINILPAQCHFFHSV